MTNTPEAHFATLETTIPNAEEHALARRHAPVIRFDVREPFLPSVAGYTVFREDADSPSFPRKIELTDGAVIAIEYAVWWDFDIGHLYELEHIWVYLDEAETIVRADASWHGGWNRMLDENGHVPTLAGRVAVYSESGKHAFAATTAPLIERRPVTDASAGIDAGKMAVHVTPLFEGIIEDRTPINNRVVLSYLKTLAFEPTYDFSNLFGLENAALVPWLALFEYIPRRVHWWTEHLKAQIPYEKRHVFRIAHRGASAHAQEGSASSIEKAAELGADMIEIDIRFTADGVPVIFHDSSLKRVFGVDGLLGDLTLEELRQIIPADREPIMTFEEMVTLCKRLSLGLYLDIKELNPRGMVSVIDILDELGMFKYTIFSAFRADWVAEIKAHRPDAVTSVLFNSVHVAPLEIARAVNADYVHPCFERYDDPQQVISGEWIETVREAGLGVVCWHEERPHVIDALYDLGVDGICSDNPERLYAAYQARR